MSSDSNERRKQPRIDVCFTARFEGAATKYDARITDLSEGGCYVDSIAEVLAGETLRLSILSDDEWVELQAIVAHHFPRLGFGVRFVNLDAKQQAWLRSMICPGAPGDTDQVETSHDAEFCVSGDQIDLTHRRVM